MMNYQQFKEKIKEMLLENIPNDYSIENKFVENDNGGNCDVFVLAKESFLHKKVFMIEEAYQCYLKGNTIDEIIESYNKTKKNSKNSRINVTIQELENSIYFVLVNAEKSKKLLSYVPHRIIGDMAVVYKSDLNFGGTIIQTSITDSLAAASDFSEKNLFEIAYVNTKKLKKPILFEMNEVTILDKKSRKNLLDVCQPEQNCNMKMFVLTSEDVNEGASVVLYNYILDKICYILGTDNIFLIPSSRNEWIIVSVNADVSAKELEFLLRSVNESYMTPTDFLSNNLYCYKKHTNGIVVY